MDASLPLAQTLASVAPWTSLDAILTQFARFAAQERHAAAQTAVSEERKRISREMHDTVAQGFTAILLQLEAAEEYDQRPAGRSRSLFGAGPPAGSQRSG